MSLTPNPSLGQRFRAHLQREWYHFEDMPVKTLLLLALPSLVLFAYAPTLPPAAYLLQLWAGSSRAWQDRWGSMRAWKNQSTCYLCLLALCVVLDLAHVWIIPHLLDQVQTFWDTYLPGQLTFSPLEIHGGVLVRALLLLPAAPLLAYYYEWIDPRARRNLTRILTPAERAKKPVSVPDAPALPEPAPATSRTTAAPPEAARKAAAPPPAPTPARDAGSPKPRPGAQRPLHRKAGQPDPAIEQLTIESYLAPSQTQPAKPAPASRTKPAATPKPKDEEDFDWNDVRE